jgi:hypothetical protein
LDDIILNGYPDGELFAGIGKAGEQCPVETFIANLMLCAIA